MIKAALFDLDDTLYDHLYSARHGLIALSRRYAAMQEVATRELEACYSHALEAVHKRLLRGEVTQQQARTQRMQQVFRHFKIEVSDETAYAEYQQFRRDYDAVCRVVAGSHQVLRGLQQQGVRLAVITNNLVSEQIPKLAQLELADYFEVVSISEEVGVSKPNVEIFQVTLDRLSLAAEEVVMVGDSLSSDIDGALNAGIRPVWLKRRPESTLQPPHGVATIESDFVKTKESLTVIVGD